MPEWAMGLTTKLATARLGFRELEVSIFPLVSHRYDSVFILKIGPQAYMVEMVEQRQELRTKPTEEDDYKHSDLFNNLLTAAEEESASGAPTLTQREVVGLYNFLAHLSVSILISSFLGNIFIFLLAGHEVRFHLSFLNHLPARRHLARPSLLLAFRPQPIRLRSRLVFLRVIPMNNGNFTIT